MNDESLLSQFINHLTPKDVRCRRHKFSNHQVHRYLTTLSNLDIFAADLVTHIMTLQCHPHIPSIYFGCVGIPPTTWLTGKVLKKVNQLYSVFSDLQDKQPFLEWDDLTYPFLEKYFGQLVCMGNLQFYLAYRQLLEIFVLIAASGALAYGKGLKRAPTLSVNFIRHALHVYRLSGVVDDDIFESLMLTQ